MRAPSLPLLLLALGVCLLVLPGASPTFAAAQEGDNDDDGVDVIETLLSEAEEAVQMSAGDVETSIHHALDELDAAASARGKETLKQNRDKVARAKKAVAKGVASDADGRVGRGGVPLDSIVERLDKLERRVQVDGEELGYSLDSLEDDNNSMLEIVSQTVFDYITTRLTPKTDRECSWSYSQCKCVPKCRCSYQFQLGDYTLSRSCRVNRNTTAVELCDPDAHEESDDNMLVQAQRALLRGLGQLERVLDSYAPATSPECDWRWSSLRCEPREECRFYLKLGDYHVGRSCRLRVTVEAELAEKKREKEEREAAAKARKALEEEEDEEEDEDEDEEDEDEEDDEEEEEVEGEEEEGSGEKEEGAQEDEREKVVEKLEAEGAQEQEAAEE